MNAPRLPHHRMRIDERRDDPAERTAVIVGAIVGMAMGVLIVIAALAYAAGAG